MDEAESLPTRGLVEKKALNPLLFVIEFKMKPNK
jgi:hypothetical protein